MKNLKLFISVVVFLGITVSLNAADEFKKEYKDSFNVNADATFKMINHFADVECQVWDQNVIDIVAIITVYAKDQKKADKIFNKIDIVMNGTKDLVTSKTTIGNFGSGSTEFDIHFTVKLPATLALDFDCDFGNIYLGDYKGTTDIRLQYGELQIDQLQNVNNEIDIEYGELIAEKIGHLKLRSDYSEIKVDQIGTLDLKSTYSEYEIDELGDLKLRSAFDEFEIGKLNEINGTTSYSEIEIDYLSESLDLESDFGEVSITSIDKGFEYLLFESTYCDGRFGFQKGCSYNFSAHLEFSSLYMDGKSKLLKEKYGIQTYKYEGEVGGNSSSSKVRISAEFATIEIK